MNENLNNDEESLQYQATEVARIIGFDITELGRKNQVDTLLQLIKEKKDKDDDGRRFTLEVYHKVPGVNASLRLRLSPVFERKEEEGVKKFISKKKEFALHLTTGDFITSDEEELELKTIASQLEGFLCVKCRPIVKRFQSG